MASSSDNQNGASRDGLRLAALLNGEGHAPYEDGSTGADQLREMLGVLWRGKWIVAAVMVLTLGGVAAYTYTLPERYQTATLLLVEPGQGPVSESLNLQLPGMGRGQGQSPLANEMLVIRQSMDLAHQVARRLLEMSDAPATGEPLAILRTPAGERLSAGQVAGRLLGRVSVEGTGQGQDALRIGATSTQPGEAAAVANAYAEEYIARTRNKSQADIRGSRQFLQSQATKLQGRLDSLENRLSNYKSRQGAAALDEEASRLVQQIAQLEAQRDEARITLEMKQASLQAKEEELKKIEPKLVERAASGVESELRQVQKMKAARELQLEQIYQQNPELRDDPDQAVRDLQKEISRLGDRAQALSKRYVDEALSVGGIDPTPGEGGGQGLSYVARQREQVAQMRVEVSGLEAKLRTLNQRLEDYRARLKNIPDQSIQLAQMQRARQSAEKLYTFIIEKLQEARIAEESKVAYAEILRAAPVPGGPVTPQKRRNLLMGLMLGLMLGGGLVLLRAYLDTHLHRPEDLKEQGFDVAGVVPDMQPMIDEDFAGQERLAVRVAPDEEHDLNTGLSMLLSPMSAPAEAYRRLRTTIQFSRPDTVLQTLLVTSPGAGEGKTTTALNLAIAMAQADRRTLVVDADLRRPQGHQMMGYSRHPGLADVLFGQESLEAALTGTGVENLTLLPAGHEAPKPADLLSSKKMRALIGELRQAFDVILFDTPPVGAFSDAMLLSTQCDGTLLVARTGMTDRRAYAHAVETLDDVGGALIGAVLNGFDARKEGYGYDYGYRYQQESARTYYDEADRRTAEA